MGTLIGSQFLNLDCIDMNGVDEYATRLDPSFKADTIGAWSIWFQLDAVLSSNGQRAIIGYGATAAGNNSVFVIGVRRDAVAGTGTYVNVQHRATNGGTVCGYLATTTALSAGVWYHCVVQTNGTLWSVRVNDVSQTMTKWFLSGPNNNGDWYGDVSGVNHTMAIGANWNAGPTALYGGKVDEIVYKSGAAFTAGEATALYNGGTPINPHRVLDTDMKLWIRCGDSRDDATTMYDESGNGNDFTLVNMDASNYVTP